MYPSLLLCHFYNNKSGILCNVFPFYRFLLLVFLLKVQGHYCPQYLRWHNIFYYLLLTLAIVLVMWVSALTLKFSQHLYRVLGKTGLNLMGRIMGILIAALAIQFVITGLRDSFPNLWK